MLQVKLNNEKNGIELYFEGKPSNEVLESLKSSDFKWSKYKMCWYAKQNENTLKFAESLAESKIEIKPTKKSKSTKGIPLFDRLNQNYITGEGKETNNRFTGVNYNLNMSTTEISKEIRKVLRSNFKECKFSVTTNSYSGGSSIYIMLKQSPFENKQNPHVSYDNYDRVSFNNWKDENNLEIQSIIKYAEDLMNSFNFDNSDSQTDYFHVNFYGHCQIDCDYKQIEQTEEHKEDIEDFRKKLQKKKEHEKQEKEIEMENYRKEHEQKRIESKKREEQNKKDINSMLENITIKNLDTKGNCKIIKKVKYPRLNKNSMYSEYLLQKDFDITDTIIQREVIFKDLKSLNTFKNNLLTDFDFLTGLGGSYTTDKRIKSMDDFSRMTKEERSTVKWYTLGVAIYLNDKLQFVSNPEGGNYSRYAGLIDNNDIVYENLEEEQLTKEEKEKTDKIIECVNSVITFYQFDYNNLNKQENYKEFKSMLIEELRENKAELTNELISLMDEKYNNIKETLRKIITVCDSLQEQFNNLKLEHSEDITMFSLGMGISADNVKYIEHKNSTYAQYTDVVKVTYKIPRKKHLRERTLYKDVIICKGKIDLPQDFNYITTKSTTGFTSKMSKYGCYDKKYWNDLIQYIKTNNLEVLVNTVEPIL